MGQYESLGLTPFLGAALASAGRFPRRAIPWAVKMASDQVRFTLVEGVPLVALLAFATGAAVALEVIRLAGWLGVGDTLGLVLSLIIVRHFGPLLTAILVLGRSGTAVVTEMATVRLTGEVSGLEALGISPLHYYVYPRLAGGALSMAALMVVFDFAGLAGAWSVASIQEGMTPASFLESLLTNVSPVDVAVTLFKGVLYGLGMVVLCVHAGLAYGTGATQIPIAARRGVIRSLLFMFTCSVAFALLPGV